MPRLRELNERLPRSTVLYNLYGPTETNVCTYHRVRPEDLARDEPPPIGSAVGNARLIVVDEHGRPSTPRTRSASWSSRATASRPATGAATRSRPPRRTAGTGTPPATWSAANRADCSPTGAARTGW